MSSPRMVSLLHIQTENKVKYLEAARHLADKAGADEDVLERFDRLLQIWREMRERARNDYHIAVLEHFEKEGDPHMQSEEEQRLQRKLNKLQNDYRSYVCGMDVAHKAVAGTPPMGVESDIFHTDRSKLEHLRGVRKALENYQREVSRACKCLKRIVKIKETHHALDI